MPTISIFFGLIIRMYYKDHQPPHIHVQYQNENNLYVLDSKISGTFGQLLVVSNF